MKDQAKTKKQLIDELGKLLKRNAEFKKTKAEYRKTEQSLEELREKYKNIAELITDGIITSDLKGVVTSVNNSFLELTGFPRDKIVGRHFSKLPTIRMNDIPGYIKLFSSMIMGKIPEPFEFLWIHKDGTERWGEGYFCFLRKGRKKVGIQAILKNITERKRVEEALRESEERFRTVYENMTIGLYRTTPDGRILMANPALVRMLGYSSDEELAQRNLEKEGFEPEYPRSLFRQRIEREGQVVGLESAWTRGDGITLFVRESASAIKDEAGTILYYEGTAEDITVRKQAEEALHESVEKFRLLSEQNLMGIIIIQEGLVKYVNKAASQITEYSIEEALDWKPNEFGKLFHPDDLEFVMAQAQKKQEGANDVVTHYSYRIITKLGKVKWVDQYSKTLTFEKKHADLITIIDITERKKTEEALKESEEKYRVLVENATDLIFMINRELKVLTLNKAAAKLWKKEQKEIIGKSIFEIFPEQIAIGYSEDLKKIFETGKPHSSETRMVVGKTETWINTNLNPVKNNEGKIIAIMGVTRDVTEHKKAEEALRDSEEKISTILKKSPIPTAVGGSDGSIISFNEALETLIGYKRSEINDTKDWAKKLYPNKKYREFVEKNIKQALIRDKQECTEFTITCKDGSIKVVDFHTSFFKDGLVIQMVDITERRQAEEEGKQLQAQLIHSEKMAGIGTLTSGIAHEFNNLLQIMSGHSEFAQRTKKQEDMEEALDIVGDTSERVSKIIKDLLTFSSRDALERKLSSIPELIDFVLSMTEEHLKKHNIEVVREYRKIPNVEVNKGEMQQVFLNMITNARDAMLPNGGKLEIGIKKVTDNVEISFTDSGIGIEEENLGRVFEPFYTTKGAVGGDAKTQGIGLGLSVSYGIVERHGGMIEVESKAQKKTTFTVRLPARVEKAEKRVVKEKKEVKVKKTKPVKVLVIDDEEEILKMFTKWLSAEGHQVKSVLTGEKAIGLVKKESFDIVFLDIVMPGIPAIDTLAEIKELSPKTKIFMITGKLVDKELWKELKAKGASGYLQKPFKIENIKNCLAKIRD